MSLKLNGTTGVEGLVNLGEVTSTGSTTARTLANRFADLINVLDFGAVGNGIVDDTAAIQAAINYAQTTKGSVFIPSGYTFATKELYLDSVSGCSIIGQRTGHSVSGTAGSNLLYTGTATCINIGDRSGAGAYIYRYFLSNFSIFFSQNAVSGISAKNISECSFDGVSVWADTKVIQNGIKIDGGIIIFINQCTTSNTVRGINLISGSTPNTQQNFGIYITQCNLWNHSYSIILGGSHGVNIYGNWIEGFQDAILIGNLLDTVNGLEVLALSINDNVIVQSTQGLTETRALRIINNVPQEQFYVYGMVNNNYIRMDANLATKPTYAISIDMAGYSSFHDLTFTIRDNIIFGVTGAAIFADSYQSILLNENNKCVASYGSSVQAPITSGPFTDLSSVYTLIQNAVSLSSPNNTTRNVLFSATAPGQFIQPTGSIRIKSTWEAASGVTNDYVRIRLGSPTGPVVMEKNLANETKLNCETSFLNANSKTSGRANSLMITGASQEIYTINTTIDVSTNYPIYFEVEKANAARAISLTTFTIEVMP